MQKNCGQQCPEHPSAKPSTGLQEKGGRQELFARADTIRAERHGPRSTDIGAGLPGGRCAGSGWRASGGQRHSPCQYLHEGAGRLAGCMTANMAIAREGLQ